MAGSRRSRPVERGGRGKAEPRTEGRGAARCRTGRRADVAPPADTATRLPVERGKATSTEGSDAADSPREHDDVRAAVASALARALPAGGGVGIALSGGRDSIVLLDAAHAVATARRCDIVGLHVHHGLSHNADAWAGFCRAACEERRLPFAMRHVQVPRAPRASLEAAARAARYAALPELADEQPGDALLVPPP